MTHFKTCRKCLNAFRTEEKHAKVCEACNTQYKRRIIANKINSPFRYNTKGER